MGRFRSLNTVTRPPENLKGLKVRINIRCFHEKIMKYKHNNEFYIHNDALLSLNGEEISV